MAIKDVAKMRAGALPPVPAARVAAKTVQGKRSLMDALTKVGTAPAPMSQSAKNLANRDKYEEIPEAKIRRP